MSPAVAVPSQAACLTCLIKMISVDYIEGNRRFSRAAFMRSYPLGAVAGSKEFRNG